METENKFDEQSLVGLPLTEAVEKAQAAGFKTRIKSRDGVPMVGTRDARKDRINFRVTADKIESASIG